jgi:hypothetical protein
VYNFANVLQLPVHIKKKLKTVFRIDIFGLVIFVSYVVFCTDSQLVSHSKRSIIQRVFFIRNLSEIALKKALQFLFCFDRAVHRIVHVLVP